MNELAPIEPTPAPHIYKPTTMLDPARFAHLWRLAEIITDSSLVPETLRTKGTRNSKEDLPRETVLANVFLVVEQADRWDISPFSVISCASIVHGRLGFEGKLVAAVIEAKLGVKIDYQWNDKQGDDMAVAVSVLRPGEREPRVVEGTVRDWKTTGEGSPWAPKNYRKMLAYRGIREWARLWAPALMMGVLGDDELFEIAHELRAARAENINSLASRYAPGANAVGDGFDRGGVQKAIADARGIPMNIIEDRAEMVPVESTQSKTEAQQGGTSELERPATRQGSTAETSATPAHEAGRAAPVSQEQRPSTNTDAPPTGSSSPSDGASAAGSANAAASPHKVSRQEILDYSEVLMRANQPRSLPGYRDQHWKGKDLPRDDKSIAALKKVMDVHTRRITGEYGTGETSVAKTRELVSDIAKDFS